MRATYETSFSKAGKKLFYVLFFLLLIVPVHIHAQDKEVLDSLVRVNSEQSSEKVYLHFDRPNYHLGDTIWFKAYLWYGGNQEPDTLSQVLHVDLISSIGHLEQSRTLLISNGTSEGTFTLGNDIPSGAYTIRAFTRLMHYNKLGTPFEQKLLISQTKENFQVECVPSIFKNAGADSLQVKLSYFEVDSLSNLDKNTWYDVKYAITIGNRNIFEGQIQAFNTQEKILKCGLGAISEKDSMARLTLTFQKETTVIEKQFSIALADPIDLQFFPEGGNLVIGQQSKVAFKAIGTDGLSRELKGIIKNGQGDTITSFETLHKGMGSFLLTPQLGKQYFAHLYYKGRFFQIPLPTAMSEGCAMTLNNTNDKNNYSLLLNYTSPTNNPPKYILVSSYGLIKYAGAIKTSNGLCRMSIPLAQLPEGICALTVLNAAFEPLCERLFYANKKERIKIEIAADKANYQTRDKVVLMVKSTKTDGSPAQANLSLAVTDKQQIIKDGSSRGINAYKLLESELRGNIEGADFYFRGDSVNFQALDLLLLTQGFRRFLPVNGQNKLTTNPERYFSITGKIELPAKTFRRKKNDYRSVSVTLMSWNSNSRIYLTKPDSLGRFSFQLPLFLGNSDMFLQATNSRKKQFNGEIILDEVTETPWQTPLMSQNRSLTIAPAIEYVRQFQDFKKTEIEQKLKTKLKQEKELKTVLIDEVVVKRKDRNWYKRFDKEAVKIVNLDSLDPTGKKFESLNDLLVREFGGRLVNNPKAGIKGVFLPCISPPGAKGMIDFFPVYVVNGNAFLTLGETSSEQVTDRISLINSLHVNEIKKIMVLPPSAFIISYYEDQMARVDGMLPSMVVIETYKKGYRGDPDGCKRWTFNGLDAPRAFYSPHYEGALKENPNFDRRATIFWAPSVKTDAKGMAKVEFYSSDKLTDLEVIANGFESKSGITGEGKTEFGIKEK